MGGVARPKNSGQEELSLLAKRDEQRSCGGSLHGHGMPCPYKAPTYGRTGVFAQHNRGQEQLSLYYYGFCKQIKIK